MDVLIDIAGQVQTDNERETMELTTVGRLEPTDGGYIVTYEEKADGQPTDAGLGNAITTMRITPPLLELERTGEIQSLLLLEQGRRHICSYTTPYGQLQMGIYTRTLRSTLSALGTGSLEVQYSLDMQGSGTSEHDLKMRLRPLS